MTIGYYPGCTLKSKARNLEVTAMTCLETLGVKCKELSRWNCCGAVTSLADDDLIHHLAPVRDLVRAKDEGHDRVVTLCSMCYNTLARANLLMRDDEPKRKTINLFMEEETDYFGEVKVQHYLDLLRTDVTWEKVHDAVKVPLEGLRVGGYWGCTLLRPLAVAIDQPDQPTLLAELLRALGATPVDFPESQSCCSSYQILANEHAALEASSKVLRSATEHRIEAIVTSCPVCEYNLGRRQADVRASFQGIDEIPTYYFTQLLAVALGLPLASLGLELNTPNAEALMRKRNYIRAAAAG